MPQDAPNELPKAYDPALIEQKWATFWVDEHIFDVPTPTSLSFRSAAEESSSDPAHAGGTHPPFVQLLPPPNVTGRLHMGHMLNQTEMDILTRWHRMSGETALWVPGTDHAGIATQMMVERQLAAEGKKRSDFSREAFTEKVWAWKHEYGSAITDQMKRLGASVDWSREYFTMDDRLSVAVREAFVRLYEQGLIYRGAYIVNWDPVLQTAVSDLEVESEERSGKLYHIRYPLADGTGSIVIATTRPETMLGDTAVAVNPADERYTALIGKSLQLPLSAAAGKPDRTIPIIADDWANPEFGTGAVKVTPAHDPNDFAIGQRHPGIGSINILDKTAHIDLPGSPFHGLDRYEAREQVVEQLRSLELLVDLKDHPMTVPISQRTGTVIEPRLSMQWFLAVNKQPDPNSKNCHPERSEGPASPEPPRTSIAAKAIAAVDEGHITFTPDNYRKTYMEWMNNIHDWCISRQLWWGHRIPAWHCNACGKITVSRDAVTACSGCGITDIHQDPDVLDTWFSSGLLPFTVFGWPGSPLSSRSAAEGSAFEPATSHPEAQSGTPTLQRGVSLPGEQEEGVLTPDLAAFYPTQLLVTGFDILFFWVARMIMLGTHFMLDVPNADGTARELKDAVPFRNVYIHALVRDANREKMSKTKGNVIDPIGIVKKYGTDAVRFTLASQASPGTDIAFNEARTEGYRAFANKIWNAARFLQLQIANAQSAGYTVTLNSLSFRSAAEESASPEAAIHVSGTLTPLETRWITSRLHAVSAEVDRALTAYRFDEAASAVYQFFWGEFCDWYIELVKLRLNFQGAGSREQGVEGTLDPKPYPLNPETQLTLNALVSTFESALRLLSPFMPFLTEELWHALYASIGDEAPAKSIALTRYPQGKDFAQDFVAVSDMQVLQEFITLCRNARKQAGVPEKETTAFKVLTLPQLAQIIIENTDIAARQTRSTVFNFVDHLDASSNVVSSARFDVEPVYERQIDVPAERERLLKDIAKYEKGLEAANRQLNNEGFIARAPAHIVEGLRKQAAETQALLDKARAALAALPPA